jgi:MFS family permease
MSTEREDGAHRDRATAGPGRGEPAPDVPPGDVRDTGPSRGEVLDRQQDRFGGIKWGSAFFGWLTALGTAVLLSALLAAVGSALGVSFPGTAGEAGRDLDLTRTAGVVGAVAAAAVLLVAYYCGGYVAGRMARFDGAKQGLAVWVWTIVVTVVVAVLAAFAGDRFDVSGRIDGLPKLPVSGGALTLTAIVAALAALAVALAGAVLGGLAGMWFHRRVDRAGPGTR